MVINPAFYSKLQNSELFNSFFLTIVFEGLESKYGIELERNWTILKNKKCMGVLHPHCIRSKSKPVIMEMEEEFKSSAPEGQFNVFFFLVTESIHCVTYLVTCNFKRKCYRLSLIVVHGLIIYINKIRQPV